MLTDPDRLPPLFEATVTVTFPPPDTFDTDVLSQSWSSLTVHEQSERPSTVTSKSSPAAADVRDVGLTESGDDPHGSTFALWVTFTVCPPMLSDPERLAPEFPCAVTRTVAPPEKLEGLTLSQLAPELALNVQSERPAVVTSNDPAPAPTVLDVGSTESRDDGHGGVCVTATPRPPMVTVPERSLVPVCFFTVMVTESPPEMPLEGSTVNQLALELAVYTEQSERPRVETENEVALSDTVFDAGLTESRDVGHGGVCVTATPCPPMVTVPERSLVPVCFFTVMVTESPPAMPLEGSTLNQLALELAVYTEQSERPRVETENEVALSDTVFDAGLTESRDVGHGGVCVTATPCPPMVTVPERSLVPVCFFTVMVTESPPAMPLEGSTLNQLALELAVYTEQSERPRVETENEVALSDTVSTPDSQSPETTGTSPLG